MISKSLLTESHTDSRYKKRNKNYHWKSVWTNKADTLSPLGAASVRIKPSLACSGVDVVHFRVVLIVGTYEEKKERDIRASAADLVREIFTC